MKRPLAAAALGLVALFGVLTAPAAIAIPPDFPNLDAFTPASPNTYVWQALPGSAGPLLFNTPFGYTCKMGGGHISCGGNQLPGYVNQTELRDSDCGQMISSGYGQPAKFSPQPIYCTESGGAVLQSGNKLSFEGLVCGVGADFTACIDTTKHGFVLRQDGNSSVF